MNPPRNGKKDECPHGGGSGTRGSCEWWRPAGRPTLRRRAMAPRESRRPSPIDPRGFSPGPPASFAATSDGSVVLSQASGAPGRPVLATRPPYRTRPLPRAVARSDRARPFPGAGRRAGPVTGWRGATSPLRVKPAACAVDASRRRGTPWISRPRGTNPVRSSLVRPGVDGRDQGRQRVGNGGREAAEAEEGVVVLGVADADDPIVDDPQLLQGRGQASGLRHARGQDHDRRLVEDDVPLQTELLDGGQDG